MRPPERPLSQFRRPEAVGHESPPPPTAGPHSIQPPHTLSTFPQTSPILLATPSMGMPIMTVVAWGGGGASILPS